MSDLTGTGTIVGSAINAAASIANASNSFSNSSASSFNDSWGQSWENSQSEAWSNLDALAESYNVTHGREASAADILRAQEANQQQQEFLNQQMAYNSAEAAKNRAFEKEMSNTSYQRAVKDMIAAGINPMLAVYNGGASTPVGTAASSGLATANKATTYAQSEGGSRSSTTSRSGSTSSSSGGSRSGSHGESSETSHSESNTQLKSMVDMLGDLFNGLSSASEAANVEPDSRVGNFSGEGRNARHSA